MKQDPLNQPLLGFNNIHKYFGYKRILKGVNLELNRNRLTLLVGKNGAGKSTLVKILTGLMRPTQGTILFQGKDIQSQAKAYRESVGIITHDVLFYGDLTARENLTFFGRLRSLKKLDQEIHKVLKATDLLIAADVAVKTFSSGMCKRLNIARLMLSRPKILFLDEPYSGLDFTSIGLLNNYIESIKQEGGSILLISHQVDSCFDQIDQVAYLNEGKISGVVPKTRLNDSSFVKDFFSADNQTDN